MQRLFISSLLIKMLVSFIVYIPHNHCYILLLKLCDLLFDYLSAKSNAFSKSFGFGGAAFLSPSENNLFIAFMNSFLFKPETIWLVYFIHCAYIYIEDNYFHKSVVCKCEQWKARKRYIHVSFSYTHIQVTPYV
jgi:hypothetical protein